MRICVRRENGLGRETRGELMPRLRLTIRNSGDRGEELRYAARIRQAIWASARVEIDPENPLHGTHWDEQGRPYFEFVTNFPDEVWKVLREHDTDGRVEVTEQHEALGQPCVNCGNIAAPVLPSVCPTCNFRDIAPCPICDHEVSRQRYRPISGNLFTCPECGGRVRLRLNSPLFKPDGSYNDPLVLVDTVTADHENRQPRSHSVDPQGVV